MRRSLTRAFAAGIVALGTLGVVSPAPTLANAADVGINKCKLGPSNTGHCTVLITEPGEYIMYTQAEPDTSTWTFIGCVPFATSQRTNGLGSQVAIFYVHEGKCELEFYAINDVGTVDFYRYNGP